MERQQRAPGASGGGGGDAATLDSLDSTDFVRSTGAVEQDVTGRKMFVVEQAGPSPFNPSIGVANIDPTDGNTSSVAFYSAGGGVAAGFACQVTSHTNHYGQFSIVSRGADGFQERLIVGTTLLCAVPGTFQSTLSVGASPAATGTIRVPATGSIQSAAGGYIEFGASQCYFNAPVEAVIRTAGSTRLSMTSTVAVINPTLVRLAHATAELEFGTGGPRILYGTGTPEGSRTAPVGSLFLRSDGGAGSVLYVKESGTGNTGWAAK